jgi:hypothetical protein
MRKQMALSGVQYSCTGYRVQYRLQGTEYRLRQCRCNGRTSRGVVCQYVSVSVSVLVGVGRYRGGERAVGER